MRRMPKQNSQPEQGELLPPDAAGTPSAPVAPPPAGRGTRQGRRPWWARLLGRLIEPWLGLKIEPEQLQHDPAQPVVYVLEDYGLSNALILDKACREALNWPYAPFEIPGELYAGWRARDHAAAETHGRGVQVAVLDAGHVVRQVGIGRDEDAGQRQRKHQQRDARAQRHACAAGPRQPQPADQHQQRPGELQRVATALLWLGSLTCLEAEKAPINARHLNSVMAELRHHHGISWKKPK